MPHEVPGHAAGLDVKVVTAGTHRACRPEETWSRLEPLLPELGITRVSDVTWLDEIGVPVFQAVRPRSRSLAVSQGKGLTRVLARVSAVMEGIETMVAERPPVAVPGVRSADLDLDYDVGALASEGYAPLARSARLDWCEAVDLQTGTSSFVPADVVSLDWTVARRWSPPLFGSASDGLAGGNTAAEATLHGLLELVERWGVSQPGRLAVDPASVLDGEAAGLVARLGAAGVPVEIVLHPDTFGVPVFSARLPDRGYPIAHVGSGAHVDVDVALCRALTEAVQSRATHIAGSRDDMSADAYRWRHAPPARTDTPLRPLGALMGRPAMEVSWDIGADLRAVLDLVRPVHPHVLVVHLPVAPGVHVAKVVIPTMPAFHGH